MQDNCKKKSNKRIILESCDGSFFQILTVHAQPEGVSEGGPGQGRVVCLAGYLGAVIRCLGGEEQRGGGGVAPARHLGGNNKLS